MTRDEIYQLIKYLEKNYHVKCEYSTGEDEADRYFGHDEIKIYPNFPVIFRNLSSSLDSIKTKQVITNKLDKLGLIRF